MPSLVGPARGFASFLALAAALIAPPRTSAQTIPQQPDSGFVRGAPPVSRSALASGCVVPLATTPETVPTGDCEVRQVLDLASGWTAVWYRRPSHWSGTPPIESHVDQVAVFSGVAPDRLVPRWRFEVEGLYLFVSELRSAARAQGTLFELHVCLNGTGGCGSDYLLLGEDGALHVVAMPFVAALQATLPAGLRLHKGMTLDLETLSGAWPVAAPEDANCCPSRKLAYQVRLEGDREGASLELVRSSLSPP